MYPLLRKNLQRHVSLDESEYALIESKMVPRTVARDEHILEPGKICRHTYFVDRGFLRLYHINVKGYEKNTLFAREEWWVSDLYSYHAQKPGTYFLQALEDTDILQLSKHDMEFLLEQIPKMERFWRILHINAFVAQQERVMHMISKTAEDRYLEFIEKYPDAELRISQRHIASYLGITPEFLSKMKSRLKS